MSGIDQNGNECDEANRGRVTLISMDDKRVGGKVRGLIQGIDVKNVETNNKKR